MSNIQTELKCFAAEVIRPMAQGMEKQLPGVACGGDIEAVHQFRVYARRMRNALWLFKEVFTSRKRQAWSKSLDRAGRACSEIRDIDVLTEYLKTRQRYIKFSTGKKSLRAFHQVIQKRRAALQPEAGRAIQTFQKSKTLKNILKNLPLDPQGGMPRLRSGKLYSKMRKRIFYRVRQLLLRGGSVYSFKQTQELHQLRLSAKGVRYSLEALRPIYTSRLDPMINQIIVFHRDLGAFHDLALWQIFTEGMIRQKRLPLSQNSALRGFMAHCCQEQRKVYAQFYQKWKQAKRNRFFEELLEYIYAVGNAS